MFETMLWRNGKGVVDRIIFPIIGIGSTNDLDRKKEICKLTIIYQPSQYYTLFLLSTTQQSHTDNVPDIAEVLLIDSANEFNITQKTFWHTDAAAGWRQDRHKWHDVISNSSAPSFQRIRSMISLARNIFNDFIYHGRFFGTLCIMSIVYYKKL